MDQMDQADVDKVTEIAEKYISPDNIQEAAGLAASGNMEGLKDMAKEQLSQEVKSQSPKGQDAHAQACHPLKG